MIIIKHGDPKRTNMLLQFECSECGAEFICGLHEVHELGNAEDEYWAHCPACYKICYAHRR